MVKLWTPELEFKPSSVSSLIFWPHLEAWGNLSPPTRDRTPPLGAGAESQLMDHQEVRLCLLTAGVRLGKIKPRSCLTALPSGRWET